MLTLDLDEEVLNEARSNGRLLRLWTARRWIALHEGVCTLLQAWNLSDDDLLALFRWDDYGQGIKIGLRSPDVLCNLLVILLDFSDSV